MRVGIDRVWSRLWTLVLGLALVVGMPAAPAGANGTPVRIVLSYLNGVSNFGPQNATGVAELVMSEGEVRVTTAGLQRLPGEQYHVWISDGADRRLWLGAFDVSEQGVGRLDRVIREDIPERDWNLMALTVEQGGTQPGAPSNRRAIAGRFPTTPGAGARPGQLPNTGGTPTAGSTGNDVSSPALWSGISREGLLLLGLLLVAGVGFGLGRAGSRRATVVRTSTDADAPSETPSEVGTGPNLRRPE